MMPWRVPRLISWWWASVTVMVRSVWVVEPVVASLATPRERNKTRPAKGGNDFFG